MKYEPVMGLEVHAQLKTNTKLFCGCSTQFGNKPNSNTCPVCLGFPGALPVLNKRAVEMAIMAGLALNCTINKTSVFARKNYFYPDLPKGYQISQFELPICEHGELMVQVNNDEKRIGITRIHMEEDAGKLIHQGADAIAGSDYSLVDLNRACTPLIEIVSEPDIRTIAEAKSYVENLRLILVHLGVCDGNLDEGSFRVDVNVSLRPVGSTEFGTRTEIKNLNSIRSMERAIQVEMNRQEAILGSGGTIIQQTRNYDDNTQTTTALRDKEDAHDYRYFPDPDLRPLNLEQVMIDNIKKSLPELPQVLNYHYQEELGLSKFESGALINDVSMNNYFQKSLKEADDLSAKDIAKWIVGDLTALLKELNLNFEQTKITPKRLVQLVGLIKKGGISGKIAKEILPKIQSKDQDPEKIIKSEGLSQISDTSQLESIVEKLLDNNLDIIEKVKAGKTKSADFLMGQVMKETRGQAKPDLVREIILSAINKR